jgi:hypothetical protein
VASKKKGGKEPCPYPGCVLKAEHKGNAHVFEVPKRTPHWNEALRAFVEHLKAGKTQTDAHRLAYPNDSKPEVHAVRKMKHPLVIEAMQEYEANRKAAEKIRATVAGAIAGRAEGLKRAEHFEILADIARNEKVPPAARISAVMGSAELLGMRVKQTRSLTDRFEGFTDQELEQYAKDGTVPERFAIRFGIAPGSSSQVM